MILSEWFPALTTTSLFAAIIWLCRNLILTRLAKSVEHEFNEKLEKLRAELQASEERLKSDLRAKEAEIAALRGGAMSALASRQAAVDRRRIEAVDQLWSSVTALGPARVISKMMSTIKFDVAVELAPNDPRIRQFFGELGRGFDPKHLDLSGAGKARPFVSPMAWATYSALLAITMHSVMRWQALRFGVGQDFVDNDAISKLITAVLPHQTSFIEKYGPTAFHFLLEELEPKLLRELQTTLESVDADKRSIEQAAEILRYSDEVLRQTGAQSARISGH